MSEKNFENTISRQSLEALLAAHDGDVALLYLYILRNGRLDMDNAALVLCRTMAEIEAAAEKLQRMELYEKSVSGGIRSSKSVPASASSRGTAQAEVLEPADELPQYTTEEIVRRSRDDGIFAGLMSECAKVIGHKLSSSDTKTLFGIYDYLSLPPEVIMELLNYCGALFKEKYGEGRRPSMRAIEKEAYRWAKKEILTFEQSEQYIRQQKERRTKMGSIKVLLGIKDRHLSKTEVSYISSWLDMGFDEEAISIAFDRTVTSTGGLKWAYMNTIMTNWHNANIHSAAEINEKDGRRAKQPSAGPVSQPDSIDMDELRNAINRI